MSNTTVTITPPPGLPKDPPHPQGGDYYQDVSCSGGDRIYLLASVEGGYVLVCVRSGDSYNPIPAKEPIDAFAGDRDDFVLLSDVEINIPEM